MGKFAFKIPTTGKNYNERDKNTKKLSEKENKIIKNQTNHQKNNWTVLFCIFISEITTWF